MKVHKSDRHVIAICDIDLKGTYMHEGNMQLDLSTEFFNGNEMDAGEVRAAIEDGTLEDATFYIVGKKSTDLALSTDLITQDGIKEIDSIPFALVLL